MPAVLKNNLGVVVTVLSYLVMGAVSWGAAQTILGNLKDGQIKLESKFDTFSTKIESQWLDHDRKITTLEAKIK